MITFIEQGVQHARFNWIRRSLLFISGPILTALIVLGILWLLPSPPIIPTPPPTVTLVFLSALHWMRVFAQSLFPWPATLIIIAAIFFGSASAFGNLLDLFGLFRKVKIFGAEVELNEQTKRKLQTAATDIAEAVGEYKERISLEVSHRVSRHQVDRALALFVDNIVFKTFGHELKGKKFRCTVHIPDPVQEDHLYQLLDYYPEGGGAFRSYSDRYGIIGKVWRSEQLQIVNTLLDIPEDISQEQRIAMITRDWGMTKREAERALSKPSYLCFLLEHDDDKIGVLYMDSEEPNAFATPTGIETEGGKITPEQLADTIRNKANEDFSARVSKVLDDLADVSLRIRI